MEQEGVSGLALNQALADSVPITTEEVDDKGYKIVRQEVNAGKLDKLLNTEIMEINATITTAPSITQRNQTLNDLLIAVSYTHLTLPTN